MIISRHIRLGKAARAYGRNGWITLGSLEVQRSPLLDLVGITAWSRRKQDARRAPVELTLDTGTARRLYAALGSVLDHVDANKQTTKVQAEAAEVFGIPANVTPLDDPETGSMQESQEGSVVPDEREHRVS